ncbi:MAG TPA: LysM peptidoglycan-binding domain-containing protein [Acidimicrobiales bacterium]|nr:LysM peptidoglycan-binding domain-containing protein [Acidimicrobiales bacterium]
MAVGLLLLAVAAALVTVQAALAGTGGGPLATTGAAATQAGQMSAASAEVYVVRPGDTLWSIARRFDPHGDVRPLVDRLAARIGGATVYPGEPIPVPGGAPASR